MTKAYFITASAYMHQNLFQRTETADLLLATIIRNRDKGEFLLHEFVIMPNHVHLLVTPNVPSRKWLGPLKGFTGHEAIRILGLNKRPFWQDESYDHLIRNDEESARIKHYIDWNPVKAGLATLPEEFPFSSATSGRSPTAGRKA